jgi:hypothetical protein
MPTPFRPARSKPSRVSDFSPSLRTLARLTLDRPGAFTQGELLAVTSWLEKQARDLRSFGEGLTKTGRFTARVMRTANGLEAK